MSTIVYGIPNCDTVKKARAWLSEQGVEYSFHDYKKQGVPADRVDAWIASVGWEPLVNRQGTTWRKLDEATKSAYLVATAALFPTTSSTMPAQVAKAIPFAKL